MKKTPALLIAAMAAAAGASLLAGCPQRQCRRSHNEVQLIPQYVQTCTGASCTLRFSHFLPVTIAVCDEWADTPARAISTAQVANEVQRTRKADRLSKEPAHD
jgi:hypothetical protein